MHFRGIHHVGVAVSELDEAIATYERLFDARVEHRGALCAQGVEAASLLVGTSRVEILMPLQVDSPVGRFLDRRGRRTAGGGRPRRKLCEAFGGGVPRPMTIEWYLVLSSLLFAIGAMGILIRRSPIVILLCLELMLNAGTLALVAFSRMLGNQEGQIFALVVMVVAACEVVVGLGLIVAIFRRRLPLDVDELRELRG